MSRIVIAIDGPAASGKGTIARAVAARLDLVYLDTGKLYRAVGLAVLDGNGNPEDQIAAEAAARRLDPAALNDPRIRTDEAAIAASKVAAIPGVRAALLDFQREFAQTPPGAVLDGRDIGTVVCPSAAAKLYVTADIETRARRRHKELTLQGEGITYDAVLADLAARDNRDATRATAPLKPAEDADLLDTSNLSIEAAVAAAIDLISARLVKS